MLLLTIVYFSLFSFHISLNLISFHFRIGGDAEHCDLSVCDCDCCRSFSGIQSRVLVNTYRAQRMPPQQLWQKFIDEWLHRQYYCYWRWARQHFVSALHWVFKRIAVSKFDTLSSEIFWYTNSSIPRFHSSTAFTGSEDSNLTAWPITVKPQSSYSNIIR